MKLEICKAEHEDVLTVECEIGQFGVGDKGIDVEGDMENENWFCVYLSYDELKELFANYRITSELGWHGGS
jgi:hypothetical protein